jgi:hypothetical protein
MYYFYKIPLYFSVVLSTPGADFCNKFVIIESTNGSFLNSFNLKNNEDLGILKEKYPGASTIFVIYILNFQN